MTDKMRDDAIREAARNHAGDEYFNADRAYLLVSPYSGRIFDAGFDRGWQAAQAVPPKPDYSVTQLQRMKSLMGKLGLATDESLEAFCLDADRQLSRVITAMEKFMAKQSVPVVGEAVENAAKSIASMVDEWVHGCIKNNGNWQESLPALIHLRLKRYWPATSITEAELQDLRMCKIAAREEARRVDELAAELERLRKDAERYRWLRMKGAQSDCIDRVHYFGPKLDEAIDAAIAAEGDKE